MIRFHPYTVSERCQTWSTGRFHALLDLWSRAKSSNNMRLNENKTVFFLSRKMQSDIFNTTRWEFQERKYWCISRVYSGQSWSTSTPNRFWPVLGYLVRISWLQFSSNDLRMELWDKNLSKSYLRKNCIKCERRTWVNHSTSKRLKGNSPIQVTPCSLSFQKMPDYLL